ncbi:MAG TPA: FAD-dependent monooxygenase [Oscillatoriaceae cyanobacterium]
MTDADVIIVGAGPTGLMLAGDLQRAGVRTLVLERLSEPSQIPKAGGLSGQILDLLRHRGEWERFAAAGDGPPPGVPRFPWGGLHVDMTGMADPPLEAMMFPQPRLEAELAARAVESGAEIRRGHHLVGLHQDEVQVTAEVQGSDGAYRVTSRFLVGCDGSHSRVRKLLGIEFAGTTYPEVNRRATLTLAPGVTILDGGDLEIPGVGLFKAGFTTTARGVFAFAARAPGELGIYTSEDDTGDFDDEAPMTIDELRASLRRVLGGELPFEEARKLSRFTYNARQATRYRDGRILLAGDAAHIFPAGGTGLGAGLFDAVNLAWKLAATVQGRAPEGMLDSYETERRHAANRTMWHAQAQVALRRGGDAAAEALRELVQELLADQPAARRVAAMVAGSDIRYPLPGDDPHPLAGCLAPKLALRTAAGPTSLAALMPAARPVLLDLAGRAELRAAAEPWRDRVAVHSVHCDDRPADALLIRPDAVVAWGAAIGASADAAVPALREALTVWFGTR